jgi:hypothetical protein
MGILQRLLQESAIAEGVSSKEDIHRNMDVFFCFCHILAQWTDTFADSDGMAVTWKG